MKRKYLSVILSLVLAIALLSSNLFTLTAVAANLYFDNDSLESPFVVGEKFAVTSDYRAATFTTANENDTYFILPYSDANHVYNYQGYETKNTGSTRVFIPSHENSYLSVTVVAISDKVAVGTEYVAKGSEGAEGTDHSWSLCSSNLRNGKRAPSRGTAELLSTNGNTAVVMPTAVGNIILEHKYTPKGKNEVTTEYIAILGTKGTPVCTVPETIETVDGQALEFIDIPQKDSNGTWEWDTSKNPLSTVISAKGTNTAVAKFVPKDADNYNEVTATVNFAIQVSLEPEDIPSGLNYYTWDASSKSLKKAAVEPGKLQTITETANEAVTFGAPDETTWYYFPSTININGKVTIQGDVNFILGDGSYTTFTRGFKGDAKSSLTIFATSTGDKQGTLVVSTPNGANGKHNYENSSKSPTNGASTDNAGSIGAFTLNGGNVQLTAGNAGNGGNGGRVSSGRGYFIDSPGAYGGTAGAGLVVTNLAINSGSFKAQGGNGGNGGDCDYGRRGGGGHAGFGVYINDGGEFTVNVANNYTGVISITSGLAGKVGGGINSNGNSDGKQNMAVNKSFKTDSDILIYTSSEEITIDEDGNISGTKLGADNLGEMSANRFIYACGNPDAKDNASLSTGSMRSGGNGALLAIVLATIVVAALVAFVIIRQNKKAALATEAKPVEEKEDLVLEVDEDKKEDTTEE